MDITKAKATPLGIDGLGDDEPKKWKFARKILYRNVFHIQTISNALHPALGNTKGLIFRFVSLNMYVAEFASQRDHDRAWDGSPWHTGKLL